jgi:uncharacterized protein (DUF736 family)
VYREIAAASEGFRIFGGATEFGAARKKNAHDGDREYLSARLDDPSFPVVRW